MQNFLQSLITDRAAAQALISITLQPQNYRDLNFQTHDIQTFNFQKLLNFQIFIFRTFNFQYVNPWPPAGPLLKPSLASLFSLRTIWYIMFEEGTLL